MRNSIRVLAVAMAVAAPAAANAAMVVLKAGLSGSEEVPPVATPGTGLATLRYDDVANTLRVQADFAGLVGNTVAAHIHCCTLPGANVGVAIGFGDFPAGVQAGSYLRTFDLTLASTYTGGFLAANGGTADSARLAFVSGLLGGRAYFNVHTNVFPGGEIRGQLAAVPEPATWAMMVLGFGAVGWSVRRRAAATAERSTA